MKKPLDDDELRPEYDLKTLLRKGVRGKYAQQYREGSNVVVLDPDVAAAFPTPEAVNEALRLALRLASLSRKDA
jgi:hypothetical protein